MLAGALVAHPPILVPEVGGKESDRLRATTAALSALDATLARLPLDLVLLVSPHSPAGAGHLPVRRTAQVRGDLSRFRAPAVRLEARVDLRAAEDVVDAGRAAGFPLAWTDDDILDHGVTVPLYFLERTRAGKPFIFMGISGWPLGRFIELGGWLAHHLRDRSVLFIASGDLSHRLVPEAPAGFHPSGRVFDDLVMEALGRQQWERIEGLDPDLVEDAGECGLRPLAILLGAARVAGLASTVLSYEGPFGVGYPVVKFASRHAGSTAGNLALLAVEHYLRTREFLDPADPLPAELRAPSAVFVTLKKKGELRGCVGSLHPTEPTAAHEVVRYAVSAAVRDPRFLPVTLLELAELTATVQLLDPPEPVAGVDALDPDRYGVIVRSGDRQALLLPGLDGITTPEQQVAAACAKAGIGPAQPVELARFRTRTVE